MIAVCNLVVGWQLVGRLRHENLKSAVGNAESIKGARGVSLSARGEVRTGPIF